MFYYLYQITNNLNGKIYIGVHKTKNLNDGYMGSGKVIKSAIKKYGVNNFTKVILEYFQNEGDMYLREKELINEEFLSKENIYNLRLGGTGGWDYAIKVHADQEGFNTLSERNAAISPFAHPEKLSEHAKRNIVAGRIKGGKRRASVLLQKYGSDSQFWKDITKNARAAALTQKAKNKRVQTLHDIQHQKGEKNSQYGKCWIWHDLIGSRSIKRELLPFYLDQGWYKGRRMTQ